MNKPKLLSVALQATYDQPCFLLQLHLFLTSPPHSLCTAATVHSPSLGQAVFLLPSGSWTSCFLTGMLSPPSFSSPTLSLQSLPRLSFLRMQWGGSWKCSPNNQYIPQYHSESKGVFSCPSSLLDCKLIEGRYWVLLTAVAPASHPLPGR